jgi:sugar/nucleoside kinase (ribokinase family)
LPLTPSPALGELDLLFAGSIYVDIVFAGVDIPAPGTEVYADGFLVSPGGTANRAVAAARLGASTALLAELGHDPLGSLVFNQLHEEANLDLRWMSRPDGCQSPVTVSLTGERDRSFITYQELRPVPEWPETAPKVRGVHVGVAEELPAWVRRLRRDGTTVVGGVGWDSSGIWPASVLERLSEVDVFVPNDAEAMLYTQTESPVDAIKALGKFVELAVVTCGPRGVLALDSGSGSVVAVPTISVPAVDPTGAGDVFAASFMTSAGFGWPLEDRLRFAGLCASLSVTSLGGAASAPHPAKISRYLSLNTLPGDWTLIEQWARQRTSSNIEEEV